MRNISRLRKIREQLFVVLYQHAFFDPAEYDGQVELYFANSAKDLIGGSSGEDEVSDGDAEQILDGVKEKLAKVLEKLPEIDRILENAVSGWKLSRIGKTDIAILRLAAYEIRFDDDIPEKVAINEAVELAKQFGGDSSASFVNGVLAHLVRDEAGPLNDNAE